MLQNSYNKFSLAYYKDCTWNLFSIADQQRVCCTISTLQKKCLVKDVQVRMHIHFILCVISSIWKEGKLSNLSAHGKIFF